MSKWTRANPLAAVSGYGVPPGHFANGYTNGGDKVAMAKEDTRGKRVRKEGSTLKTGKKGGRRGLSPGATRQAKATGYTGRTPVVEVKREGPRNEKFNVKIKKASGGRIGYRGGGRTNLLEELGRVEGEHSNRNRRAEVSRIHGELNKGYKHGGPVGAAKRGFNKKILRKD